MWDPGSRAWWRHFLGRGGLRERQSGDGNQEVGFFCVWTTGWSCPESCPTVAWVEVPDNQDEVGLGTRNQALCEVCVYTWCSRLGPGEIPQGEGVAGGVAGPRGGGGQESVSVDRSLEKGFCERQQGGGACRLQGDMCSQGTFLCFAKEEDNRAT